MPACGDVFTGMGVAISWVHVRCIKGSQGRKERGEARKGRIEEGRVMGVGSRRNGCFQVCWVGYGNSCTSRRHGNGCLCKRQHVLRCEEGMSGFEFV